MSLVCYMYNCNSDVFLFHFCIPHFLLLACFFPNNLFRLMIILIISVRNNGDLMYEPLFIKIIRVARGLFITLTAVQVTEHYAPRYEK